MSALGRVLRRHRRAAIAAALLAVVLLTWVVLASTGDISELVLPTPRSVAESLGEILGAAKTYEAILITLWEIFAAFAVAAALAFLIGVPVGWYRTLQSAYEPLLANMAAIPVIIFFPVYSLVLGLGSISKIAFAATAAFFPLVLAIIAGISNTSASLISAGRSMGANGVSMMRHVALPSAMPEILNGFRIGLTLATLGVVGGEYLSGQAGLGYLMAAAGEAYNTRDVYAYVVVTLTLAIVLNTGMGLLTKLVRKEQA